ncbi:MAG: chemotaxis protein CheW [Desulfuromonadaceae bacterium]|nr:chemotaxis protein CheW [Desulfuromonadaceae bacterium]
MNLLQNEAEQNQLLITFQLGDSVFAIPSDQVQEVVKPSLFTPVHHAPDYVLGIRNLRGRVVTLIDLSVRLGLGEALECPDNRVLIVAWRHEIVGLLVDRIADTVAITPDAVQDVPANLHDVRADSLTGITRQGERTIAILNLDAVLAMSKERN